MQFRPLISVIAFLAMATPAAAQDPVQDAYGGAGVLGDTAEQSTGSGTPDSTPPGQATSPGTATARDTQPPSEVTSTRAVVPRPVTPAPGQQLPFTGFDIALLVLGGGLLLALGFALRRASRDVAV